MAWKWWNKLWGKKEKEKEIIEMEKKTKPIIEKKIEKPIKKEPMGMKEILENGGIIKSPVIDIISYGTTKITDLKTFDNVDLDDLTDYMQKKAVELYTKALEAYIKIIFTYTGRSVEEQIALFAQGRQPLKEVNELRKIAGMYLLKPSENKYIVTNTLNSKHILRLPDLKSRAFDIAVLNGKKATWIYSIDLNSNKTRDYIELANIGRSIGLYPGADFKNSKGQSRPDFPHFQQPKNIG